MTIRKIGISACFFHPDYQRALFRGKTLLYAEQSLMQWVRTGGGLPVMIPALVDGDLAVYADWLDGLVLHGGSDVAPESYGERPLKPEWSGDAVRDCYEIALLRHFVDRRKPVLGVCRGLQLINAAFGGRLHQDIPTELPQAVQHRDGEKYDRIFHALDIVPDSGLARLYGEAQSFRVNTIHHQAIRDLASDFAIEARCPDDQMIEAIRWCGPSYVVGVQWHPEFHDPKDKTLLSGTPLFGEFLEHCHAAYR